MDLLALVIPFPLILIAELSTCTKMSALNAEEDTLSELTDLAKLRLLTASLDNQQELFVSFVKKVITGMLVLLNVLKMIRNAPFKTMPLPVWSARVTIS